MQDTFVLSACSTAKWARDAVRSCPEWQSRAGSTSPKDDLWPLQQWKVNFRPWRYSRLSVKLLCLASSNECRNKLRSRSDRSNFCCSCTYWSHRRSSGGGKHGRTCDCSGTEGVWPTASAFSCLRRCSFGSRWSWVDEAQASGTKWCSAFSRQLSLLSLCFASLWAQCGSKTADWAYPLRKRRT